MQDEITLVGLDDKAAWDSAVAGRGLPSHSWNYANGLAQVAAFQVSSIRLAVVRSGGATLLMPFWTRDWAGSVDVATLPGLSGALIHPTSAAPLLLWRAFARDQGWVCGYLQLAVANDGLTVPPPDQILSHNALFVFDVAAWDVQTSVGHNLRKVLKRNDRAGAVLVTDQDRLAAAFPALYAGSMTRAGSPVDFGPAVLATWLDDPGIRLVGAEIDGTLLAVALNRVSGAWAEGHLTGTTAEGRSLHNWLVWKSIERFAQQGVRFYNVGGYGHPGDGTEDAKRRLGAVRHDLRSVRQIYDRPRYDELCRQAGSDPATLYFPAYRAGRV